MSHTKNPLKELAELKTAVPETSTDFPADSIFYQLRFGEMELDDTGKIYKAKVIRAFLDLDSTGVSVVPGSEYGRVIKPNISATATSEEKLEKSVSASIGVKFDGNFSLPVDAGASRRRASTTQVSSTSEIAKNRVIALADQQWEIAEPDGTPLKNDYIVPDQPLCRMKAEKGANQKTITAKVFVKQRHLKIDPEGFTWPSTMSIAKQKLLAILIAKALNIVAGTDANNYRGVLQLCEVHTEDES